MKLEEFKALNEAETNTVGRVLTKAKARVVAEAARLTQAKINVVLVAEKAKNATEATVAAAELAAAAMQTQYGIKHEPSEDELASLTIGYTIQGNFTQCIIKNGSHIGMGTAKLNMRDVYNKGTRKKPRYKLSAPIQAGFAAALTRAVKNYCGIPSTTSKTQFTLESHVSA